MSQLLNLSVEHVRSLLVILKVLVHHLLHICDALIFTAHVCLSCHAHWSFKSESGLRGGNVAALGKTSEATRAEIQFILQGFNMRLKLFYF